MDYYHKGNYKTDDQQWNWKTSLRPLDPGADMANKKKERWDGTFPLLALPLNLAFPRYFAYVDVYINLNIEEFSIRQLQSLNLQIQQRGERGQSNEKQKVTID